MPAPPRRTLIQLICIGLLLFSQQAALAHGVWHAAERLHGHDHRAHTHDDDHDAAESARALCSLDVAYGEVLGAICGHGACGAAVAPASDHVAWPVHSRVALEPIRAVSRGPPAFS